MIEVLPIDKLRPAADNVRRNIGDVDELAASIRAQGLLQSLLVTPNGDGTYTVVAGHRRLEACKQAGITEVNAEVRDMDDRARVEAMLVENLQREDLSALEEADAFQRLVGIGLSQRDIAERTGRSQAHVSKRLALLTLPKKAIAALDSDRITLGEALELAKLADHPKRIEEIIGLVAGPYPANVAREVAAHLRRVELEKKVAESRKLLQSRKLKVVDYPLWRSSGMSAALVIGKGYSQIDVKVREHSKLDCHAGAVHPEDGTIHYVCTTPANHGVKRNGHDIGSYDRSPADKAAAADARRATIARNKQIRAANTTRTQTIGEILKGRVGLGDVVEIAARQVLFHADYKTLGIACELLGLDPGPKTYDNSWGRKPLLDYLDTAGDNAASKLLLAVSLASGEVHARGGWYESSATAHHLRWLQEHGHILAAIERPAASKRRPTAAA